MNKLLRNTVKLIAVCILLSLGSCEKDLYEDGSTKSLDKTNSGKISRIKIEDAPFLLQSIEKFNRRKATMRGIEDLDLDLQKIIVYLGENGYTTYSIPINREEFENDDYYFENLNISDW